MSYQPAIMSASLGRAWLHNLHYKIEQAAKAGFKGIEIFYEDLDYAAREASGSDSPSAEDILSAADRVHESCQAQGLQLWFQIAKRLETDTIQIPANFLPAEQLTDDLDIIAADLRQVADMGAAESPIVRFAYENLCWSTYIDTWEKLWQVVKRVDRPNFGMCLDTFNIAGRVWADPADATGKTQNADADLKQSLERMVAEIDLTKVFYIQVVDAERMESPLVSGHPFHVDGQPARMSWSRNARTFMYENDRGAYMPVEDVAKTIINGLGYKGYVSMELFSRTMAETGKHVPDEHAARGIAAWKKFQQRLQLE
ncbi:hypothetical protein PMG11_00085 [Penicillium brasilianum]|uniref:Xylose isomerase-like TIM barrel domain-containing protein n=1 Tax=Penicillium brasilianum TaxID=104259 RepID=A0A0F7TDZ4_PENBI|nr:hypothetical protein PMG11_00085 [Penicillium brasilianum]